jgi:hypothetical protein
MTVKLEPEEIGYLQDLLKEHLDYYRSLAGHQKCTPKNRQLYELVNSLWGKLTK